MESRYQKNEKKRKQAKKKKNKKLLKKLLILLIIIIIMLILWGFFIEVNLLKVNDYKIKDEKIPSSFNNTTIVHFSDIHFNSNYNIKKIEKLINKINSYKPDIVVFTGDLISKNYKASKNDIEMITNYLSKINSTLGKYAVIGNDDFYNEEYENILYNSEFILLKNNYDLVYNKSNDPIIIYGIDNITYGDPKTDDLKKQSIENIPYKIVLLHEPDYIDNFINDYDINLILAGHSQNGLVKLPKIKPLMLPQGAKKYYSSYYKINNSKIYISNGIGSNFRLFNTPSINVLRLN